jgi:shikimate 5-dehydrogenase
VLDMIYRPKVTRFLRAARQRGCVIVSGLEMFLGQAASQHEWWFEEEPVEGVMRHAAELQLEAERERA